MKHVIRMAKKELLRRAKRWGFFEYTILALVIGAIASIGLLFRHTVHLEYTVFTVRVANRERLFNDDGVPTIASAQLFTVGLTGKDALGRTNAEIIDVESFPKPQNTTYGAKETVFVSVRTLASLTPQTGTYVYKGENIGLGDWIRIEVGPVVVEGTVYDIDGRFQKTESRTMTVKAQLKTEDPIEANTLFPNSTGVDTYIADAIRIGDTMMDSHGQILAKVLDKTVLPASTLTTDSVGNLYVRPNPRKVDVFLTLSLTVKKMQNTVFFLDGQPVKINARVPLFLPLVSVEPRITEIVSDPH